MPSVYLLEGGKMVDARIELAIGCEQSAIAGAQDIPTLKNK
jgi:hypothetical protein